MKWDLFLAWFGSVQFSLTWFGLDWLSLASTYEQREEKETKQNNKTNGYKFILFHLKWKCKYFEIFEYEISTLIVWSNEAYQKPKSFKQTTTIEQKETERKRKQYMIWLDNFKGKERRYYFDSLHCSMLFQTTTKL